MENRMKNEQEAMANEPSNEVLFRYLLLSKVLAREQQGETRSVATGVIAEKKQTDPAGSLRGVSQRTLYRWLNRFERDGFKGLSPKARKRSMNSLVISQELLDFFRQQKEDDPKTSIPELIRRAKQLDLITDIKEVDRSTLWRSLKRIGVDTTRKPAISSSADKRRFAYPHRMDMALCDGKHFRAGASRVRRVALFFLDDATRLGLAVVVGTSENKELFLRGLYEATLRYGLTSALYVDHGSGFTAHDSITVCKQLGVLFIHGQVGYPQGRGKIERFNQTALAQCLRTLDGNPGVNPDCSALELRLRHFMFRQYNHCPHEGLHGQTPWERFNSDSRELRFFENSGDLKRAFVLHHKRRVSADNIVSLGGVKYEMPCGYEKSYVILRHLILEKKVCFIHEGKEIALSCPDIHANALYKRPKTRISDKNRPGTILPDSGAQMAFYREYRPIVGEDLGFSDPEIISTESQKRRNHDKQD
jgi:putative transposase